jgi:hypothetical protein
MTSDARPGGAATPPDRARPRSEGPKKHSKGGAKKAAKRERKAMLLRLDPALHDALSRWAADDLRSTNAHVEWLLRRALKDAGRLPGG